MVGNHLFTMNDVSIGSETIQQLLHMYNKANALIGIDFHI